MKLPFRSELPVHKIRARKTRLQWFLLVPGVMLVGSLAFAKTHLRHPKATAPQTIVLWPTEVPDEKGDIPAEKETVEDRPELPPQKKILLVTNVSKPTLTVYRPGKQKDTGAAVIVCPGGGYHVLAYDLEGTETCEWLNSLGVTAVLLKYRVPVRAGKEKQAAALQDLQRAVGIVRHRAREWNLDPKRIGVLGYSAGGHLTASVATHFANRTYPPVDNADRESCRPDFTLLIYPAYLAQDKDRTRLAPEINVTAETPPAFIVMTQDDGVHVESAMVYAQALQAAKVPTELHIYPRGGHGYGLRPIPHSISRWPERAAEWLKAEGWLKR